MSAVVERLKQAEPSDLAEASRFLSLLAEDESVTLQTFPDEAADDLMRRSLTRILHGDLDQHARELDRLNRSGAGIFVVVNRTDGAGRLAENVTAVRSLFVDLDGAPLQPVLTAGLDPHMVVETSPGRWHCYWLVSDCTRDQFKPIQKALARRFNGDPAVNDLSRVMRLPGFLHQKGPPFQTRIASLRRELPYSVAQVVAGLSLDLAESKAASSERQHGQDWIAMMLAGQDLHDCALHLIGQMVAKGLDEPTIRGVLAGMRPTLVQARGEARVAALYGVELNRMISGAFQKGFAPEAPLPLMREAAPAIAYPLDAITWACPLIGEAIKDIARAAQAAEEIAGASVLTAAALIAQAFHDVGVDDRRYPLTAFMITVALSGERKSECDALALSAVSEYERRAQAAYRLAKQQDAETELPNPRMLDSDPTIEGIARSF